MHEIIVELAETLFWPLYDEMKLLPDFKFRGSKLQSSLQL